MALQVPLSWPASNSWIGNDGLWSSFTLSAGTPPQMFRVLPSTSGSETWLPAPDGCTDAYPLNPGYCGSLRGVLPSDGSSNSPGFQFNQSDSWDLIGLSALDAVEVPLGYTGNAVYGFDTVVLEGTTSTTSQTHQVVAAVPDLDFWVGQFGLGPKSTNFTVLENPIQSYISNLVANYTTPSFSWAYTAGAYYQNQTQASLTLGGYDSCRFEPSSLSFDMNANSSRPLQVGVQKIIGENTLGGSSVNLLPTATWHLLDSAVPHIWLPDDAIQAFVNNFGLSYDEDTDLFLINDTMHQKMLSLNPTVTFTLSNTTVAGEGISQDIHFPYAAFDLQASYPFYPNATNYFPIRRAANDSQYTIGRTFFQEAYLIADYERNNFSVSQTKFTNIDTPLLIAIGAVARDSSTTESASLVRRKSSEGLSGGAIAAIVIGTIVGLIMVFGPVTWLPGIRRNRNNVIPTNEDEEGISMVVLKGAELSAEATLVEADGVTGPNELPAPLPLGSELEGDHGRSRARPGLVELASRE